MWTTDSQIEKREDICLSDAMSHEFGLNGIGSFGDFRAYRDFDRVFEECAMMAGKAALGTFFEGFDQYGLPNRFRIRGINNGVEAGTTLYLKNREDLKNRADVFMRDFERQIIARYPLATCKTTCANDYRHSIIIHVRIQLVILF